MGLQRETGAGIYTEAPRPHPRGPRDFGGEGKGLRGFGGEEREPHSFGGVGGENHVSLAEWGPL